MRFYNSTFFCDAGEGPKVYIDTEEHCRDSKDNPVEGWPITLHINMTGKRLGDPSVTIFLRNKSDLLTFKHSVISAISKVVEVVDD
jgi:hypothetical protein